jgi:hypothetical protein
MDVKIMSETSELDVGPLLHADRFGKAAALLGLANAIDLASEQNQITWLTDGERGKRIAAIVPADDAEWLHWSRP